MKAKYLILIVINLVFWGCVLLYRTRYESSPFLGGLVISFSISTVVSVLATLPVVLISSSLVWGLYFLAAFEGCHSSFLAGCATAFTIGVLAGFIISRPL